MAAGGVSIRAMARPDLERVLEIEHAVFAAPWSRASFEGELGNDSALPLVAELDSAVVAYMISWLVVDELHIGNIAVAPVAQRRGIGRDLLTFCLREAASRGVAYATLEVRVSNDRAIKLYEGFGFMPVALRRAYYSDTGEDALVMLKQFDRDEGSGG